MRLLALALLTLSLPAFADKVFIAPPSEPTPSEVDARTLTRLVRAAAGEEGHNVVNAAADADYELRPALLKLGGSYILSMEKVAQGKVVASAKQKVAQVDELDAVAQKVVHGVTTGERAVAGKLPMTASKEKDDEEDTSRIDNRKHNHAGTVFGVGPSFLGNLGVQGLGFGFHFGRGWEIGPITFGFRSGLHLATNGSRPLGMMGDFGLNLSWYMLQGENTPFLGMDFGYGFVRNAAIPSWNGGLSFGGTIGVALFRTYKKHFEIGFRGAGIFQSSLGENPLLASFFVGIGF